MTITRNTLRLLKELPDEFKTSFRGLHDTYASHQSVLIAMLDKMPYAKVLELGIGYGSTGIINKLSHASHSLETVPDWLEKFRHLEDENHKLELFQDYTITDWNCDLLDKKWTIAFVDNAPGESRQSNIVKLKDNAEFIIVHDTEENGYQYDFSMFKYVKTFDDKRPWTTVLSNSSEIPI